MQGTVFWMAPEVIGSQKGKGYNSKVDIWSVGCVVLEMWAGRRPWPDEDFFTVMFKVWLLLVFLSVVTQIAFRSLMKGNRLLSLLT